jgi:hypothetical protein
MPQQPQKRLRLVSKHNRLAVAVAANDGVAGDVRTNHADGT